MRKKIAILGVTGSIGSSALKVYEENKDDFEIVFVSAHSDYKKLFEITAKYNIKTAILTSEKINVKNNDLDLFFGEEKLLEFIRNFDFDILLNAIAGSAGLRYSIETIESNKDLALANKESLVMAGHIIKEKLKNSKSKLLPVDSEHSALFQLSKEEDKKFIEKLIITASGGPFKNRDLSTFQEITLKDTLKHPTWDMGAKITVDSATMMNKGLEVIEAHWLYDIPYENIEAVIHPQSIIHSMIEFVDGSILSQMSNPSMTLPILYAFYYPERKKSNLVETNLLKLSGLTFSELTKERYPIFFLAIEIGKKGGILPTILNAANEAAVHLFLKEKINFTQIFALVNNYMKDKKNIDFPNLETILKENKEVFKDVLENYQDYL